MSKFICKKQSSLAKCYDSLNNNKKKKEPSSSNAAINSSTASVVEKLNEAERKEQMSKSCQAAGPVNTVFEREGPAQRTDNVTSSAPSNVLEASGRDSPLEAKAMDINGSMQSQRKKENVAGILTDPQKLFENFFSGIIYDAAESAVDENLDASKADLCTSLEFSMAARKGEHQFAYVCDLPLKLLLTPLKRGRRVANTFASLLEMQFGPLHAALQVGNVILEWNDSSLVTPYLCAYEDEIMRIDMQPFSKWVEYTGKHHSKMKKAAEKRDFPEQIELIYTVASEKAGLIDRLIDVIVRYNKHYCYNLFDRNCQHFVSDALTALGVDKPIEFTGGLKDYYKKLVQGRTPSVPEKFKTHSELDNYVQQLKRNKQVSDIPQNDLEFILALYFRFHLESKSELRDDSTALREWKCEVKGCCFEDIEKLIEVEALQIHKFRVIGT